MLPYPSKAGLLLKMKRYISGSSLWQDGSSGLRNASAGSSRVSSRTASRKPSVSQPNAHSSRLLSESFAATSITNQSMDQNPDQTANEVLSSFFKDKGDRPLSQIEYEGVMSLLEKSRSNVTLPLNDTEQHPHTRRSPTRESSFIQHNNTTFSNQHVLKNTSMYDGSTPANATFAAPDYRPLYHNFNDTSRAAPPVKRVYQFSGLPSPYRTRIRAPGSSQKKARRIATEGDITPSALTIPESETPKRMSNTANSLLSVLDNQLKKESSDVAVGSSDRPLHNPYAKNRRRTAKTASTEAASLNSKPYGTAGDISKTVAFNQAKELAESPEKEQKDSLFSSPAKDETKTDSNDKTSNGKSSAPLFTFKPSDTEPAEKKPAFSFNLKNSDKKDEDTSKDKPKPAANGFSFDSQKPAFSFGSKTDSTSGLSNKDLKPLFGLNPPKDSEFKPRESEEKELTFALPESSLTANGDLTKEKQNEVNDSKPAFSFGSKQNGNEGSLFGQASGEDKTGSSLFGNSASNKPSTASTGFSFGSKPSADISKPSGSLFGTAADTKTEGENGSKQFNFGSSTSLFGSKEKASPPKPVFNFGAKETEEKENEAQETKTSEANPPAFSFGSSSKPITAFSGSKDETGDLTKSLFGQNATKSDSTAPAFSFLNSKPEAEKDDGKVEEIEEEEEDKKEESNTKPAFSFGASTDDKSKTTARPAFSFGKKTEESTAEPEASATPKFSFGSAQKTSQEEEKKAPFSFGAGESKPPAFSFGASSEKKEAPSFNFGAKKETTESNTEKTAEKAAPAFSFGASQENKAAPAFSFGKSDEAKKEAPAFSFGKSDEAKKDAPAFSFGSSAEKKAPSLDFGGSTEKKETPGFSFGKTEEKKDAPAFSFGKPDEKKEAPKFNFGAPAKEADKAPVFGSTPSTETKPAFNFGSSTASNDKPAFNFGSSNTSTTAKPAFNFGANTSSDKPAFNFGSSNTLSLGAKPTEDTKDSAASEFKFPELQGTKVTEAEREEAKQFESLFKF